MPTECPRNGRGMPTECPRNARGMPTEGSQNAPGMPAEGPRHARGMPTEGLRGHASALGVDERGDLHQSLHVGRRKRLGFVTVHIEDTDDRAGGVADRDDHLAS